jgi:uncharacterized protein
MQIWVDADACPKVIREILFRAAERVKVPVILVANSAVQAPRSRWVRTLQVSAGFDVADNEIVRRLETGDLVITADIPLAWEVLEKGGMRSTPGGNATRGTPFVSGWACVTSWKPCAPAA